MLFCFLIILACEGFWCADDLFRFRGGDPVCGGRGPKITINRLGIAPT